MCVCTIHISCSSSPYPKVCSLPSIVQLDVVFWSSGVARGLRLLLLAWEPFNCSIPYRLFSSFFDTNPSSILFWHLCANRCIFERKQIICGVDNHFIRNSCIFDGNLCSVTEGVNNGVFLCWCIKCPCYPCLFYVDIGYNASASMDYHIVTTAPEPIRPIRNLNEFRQANFTTQYSNNSAWQQSKCRSV